MKLTMIEWLIIAAILGIVAVLGSSAYYGHNLGSEVSYGIGGVVESRCIMGMMFVVSDGRVVQVLDAAGRGVPCPTTK